MMTHKSFSYSIYILFLVFLALVFILNYYYPFMHDDYAYSYIFGENSDVIRPTSESIASLKDVFQSICNHYLYVNGRFTSTFLTLTFSGLIGKTIFNIVNTLVIGIFCFYFYKLLSSTYHHKWEIMLPFALLIFSFPNPGETVFWMCGALNYLWGSTFALIVVYYFSLNNRFAKSYANYLWYIFAFIGAWTNESVSIPVAGGLVIYGLMARRSISKFQIITIISFCLGCMLIVFSPGTFARMASEQGGQLSFDLLSFIFQRTWNHFLMLLHYPITLFVIIVMIGVMVVKRKAILKQNMLYIGMYLTAFAFLWLLNKPEDRIYFFFVILSWILCLRLLSDFVPSNLVLKYQCAFIFLFTVLILYGCHKAYESILYYGKFNKEVVQQINQASVNCLLEKHLYVRNKDKYVYVTELSDDPSNYHNRVKSFYYQKKYIAAWPKELCELIFSNRMNPTPKGGTHQLINIDDKYLFGVLSGEETKEIRIILRYDNEEYMALSSTQKKMRRLLGTLNDSPVIEAEIIRFPIYYNGKTYFFIPYQKYKSIDLDIR